MDADSPFRLITGNRDVVASLEFALEQAKAGKLVGLVLCGVFEDEHGRDIGFHWAHKDDLSFAWPRLLAAVTDAQQLIARKGLV